MPVPVALSTPPTERGTTPDKNGARRYPPGDNAHKDTVKGRALQRGTGIRARRYLAAYLDSLPVAGEKRRSSSGLDPRRSLDRARASAGFVHSSNQLAERSAGGVPERLAFLWLGWADDAWGRRPRFGDSRLSPARLPCGDNDTRLVGHGSITARTIGAVNRHASCRPPERATAGRHQRDCRVRRQHSG